MLKGGSAASRSGSGAGTRSRASLSNASTSALPGNITEDKQPSFGSPTHEISGTGSEETDLSTSEEDSSWISLFCGMRGNQFLCEIEEDYIQDDFNLCGLQAEVPNYEYALDMILDNESLSDEIGEEHVEIESDAELLYGLIHARFILTVKGLHAMHEKYKREDFGLCPRVFCGGQPCLPVGTSDVPRNGSVKIYCPKCEDLYFPICKYQSNMDGSYIGTTFPHLYLMTYPAKPATLVQHYVPRVFGFKLHKGSR